MREENFTEQEAKAKAGERVETPKKQTKKQLVYTLKINQNLKDWVRSQPVGTKFSIRFESKKKKGANYGIKKEKANKKTP